MRQVSQVTIEGEEYELNFLMSSQSIELATLVAKKLLPSLGSVFASFAAMSMTSPDMQVGEALKKMNFSEALPALAAVLDPKEITSIVKTLCSVVVATSAKGLLEKAAFEEHFKGRPGHALLVAAASFEVNCGDFFGAAVSAALKMMSTIQAKITSTGPSTGL